jgi:hypothetical protein
MSRIMIKSRRKTFPVSGFRFRQGGTGSRVPIATQGMQRNNRDVVSQSPFGKPWTRMASSEYREQVGWNRQRMKRCVTGCRKWR